VWEAGAGPAAMDIADPATTDPATPSARIAGMIARLIRMIPSMRFPSPALRRLPPATCAADLLLISLLPSTREFHALPVAII